MQKNQKGFTIIELLVVIVIIGILVALALPNLFSAQRRGRDTDRKNALKNAQQQLETHYNDNGGYPADWTTVVDEENRQGPSSGETYTYAPLPDGCTDNDCTSYTITADLENDNDPDATDGDYVVDSVNQP